MPTKYTKYTDRYEQNTEKEYKGRITTGDKQLAASLVEGVAKPTRPKKVTLELLIKMAVYLDVEVGVFLNESGEICVSKGRNNAIIIPRGCTIIAHSHPTTSNLSDQISSDMRHASDQVEIAVNAAGLVIYYSEGHCYNRKHNDRFLKEKLDYRGGFKPGSVNLQREITPDILGHLGAWNPGMHN